eukprot:scaffold79_cov259-Pinguiococcus_pyrenoidosus.AAC.26
MSQRSGAKRENFEHRTSNIGLRGIKTWKPARLAPFLRLFLVNLDPATRAAFEHRLHGATLAAEEVAALLVPAGVAWEGVAGRACFGVSLMTPQQRPPHRSRDESALRWSAQPHVWPA